MWDAAGNGWGAVELWAALSEGRLLDFVVRLNAQDKWPFGFSLLMLPFVAGGGGDFESATLLPALAFALVPALLVWAAREIEGGGTGLAAGLLAGALWLASPLPRALATVALRETTGAALGVAALAAYLRARRRGSLGAWRLFAGLLLALFLTKYNYFLLGGAAIALHAVLEAAPERRLERLRALYGRIVHGGWRSPERWLALALGVAAAIFVAGENPGNFLYGCLVVATALALSLRWRLLSRPGRALARLAPAARGLTEALLLPLWLWALSPRPIHPRNVVAFLRNRPGELPVLSPEALAYYPRALVEHYLTAGPLAWIVVALAAAGLAALARRADGARALALAVAVGLVATTLHPLKEARFLATVVPLVLLLAATVATRLVGGALPDGRALRLGLGGAATSLALWAAVAGAAAGGGSARLEDDHRNLTSGPEYLAPLVAAAFWAGAPDRRAVGFVGGQNQLSESLVRWETWRGSGREADWVDPLRGLAGSTPTAEVERRLARWLERRRPRRVVALVPLPASRWLADADYRRHNAWQIPALAALARDASWRPERRRAFAEVGLELRSFVRE